MAMAMLPQPPVLVLDEPTSGLDPASRQSLWGVLRLWSVDRSILLVSHYLDEAEALGDRVCILSEGRVRCLGSTHFLRERLSPNLDYKVICAIKDGFSESKCLHELRKHCGSIVTVSRTAKQISFGLSSSNLTGFPALFAYMETSNPLVTFPFNTLELLKYAPSDIAIYFNANTTDETSLCRKAL